MLYGGDDTPTGVGDDGEPPRRCGIDRGAGIVAQPGACRFCWSRRDSGLRAVAGAGECSSGVVPDPRMQAGAADEQNRGRRIPTLRGDGGDVGRRCGTCWCVSRFGHRTAVPGVGWLERSCVTPRCPPPNPEAIGARRVRSEDRQLRRVRPPTAGAPRHRDCRCRRMPLWCTGGVGDTGVCGDKSAHVGAARAARDAGEIARTLDQVAPLSRSRCR